MREYAVNCVAMNPHKIVFWIGLCRACKKNTRVCFKTLQLHDRTTQGTLKLKIKLCRAQSWIVHKVWILHI